MPSLSILLVDDFEPWRRFVSSALQEDSRLELVFEASDGLEAVEKSEELQPALVLMDIGLPKLNGIEAARRIRNVAPKAKIIFLSENSTADIAEEAFRAGGCGYVVKRDAGRELLAAVQAVSVGKHYVSAKLKEQGFDGVAYADAGHDRESCRHELQFYRDDLDFLNGFGEFIAAGLIAGKAVVVVTTKPHSEDLLARLQTRGFDIGAAAKNRTLVALDVYETLSAFMVGDQPDPIRFRNTVSHVIEYSSNGPNGECRRVSACGECAPILWAQGKADAALQLERLWDKVGDQYGLDILCGYLLRSRESGKNEILEKICSEHSAVVSSNVHRVR
jgi:CheY-like chemotaxis protein